MGAAALVLFSFAGSLGAAWKCQTSHFLVISQVGPEIAAAAAQHLEEVRRRFAELGFPQREERVEPTLVLLFATRESLAPYTPSDSRDPSLTRGLSLAGGERNWIAVAWAAPGSMLTALAHEYAHLVRPAADAPLWFREGLAEYLAGLEPEAAAGSPGSVPVHHLQALREQPWIAWEEFLSADRMSAAFAQPNFYSQAWLGLHWLASQGAPPASLHPAALESLVRTRGGEWVEAELREYAEWLAASVGQPHEVSASVSESAEVTASPRADPTDAWELPFWMAEFHRELDHLDLATPSLENLERRYPEIPQPRASLAAIAIAQGQYDLAEERLRRALQMGSRQPSTNYHYSLMLLRPIEGRGARKPQRTDAEDRIRLAVAHARRAREADPSQPRYLLGEAQALVVAGEWEAAAEGLLKLQTFPGWRGRAEEEFAELIRRRQQTLRSVPGPAGIGATSSGTIARAAQLAADAWPFSVPEVPPPPPPAKPDPEPWPPPGTILLYGYINGVDCRGDEKIVTVKAPRYTIELRETAANPARLYYPPKKWRELPCGLSGYEVNVVYRALPAGGEVRGELVAVVF